MSGNRETSKMGFGFSGGGGGEFSTIKNTTTITNKINIKNTITPIVT
jgi:hypothetical protein